jgi:hypothetical protein
MVRKTDIARTLSHDLEYRTPRTRNDRTHLPRNGMSEANIPGWVDLHWQCAAAMLEAGVMDEHGEWITDKDVHLGIEAYRERFARQE